MDSKSWHCSNNRGTILQPGFKLIPKLIISLLQCDCLHCCRMHFWWQICLTIFLDRFWTDVGQVFSEQSTISLAHSGQLRGALLVDLRRLTACMVAECIFGDRLEWENAQASQRKHQNELTQFFTLCFSNTSVVAF